MRVPVVLFIGCLFVGACGDDDAGNDSGPGIELDEVGAPDVPPCDEMYVEGKILSDDDVEDGCIRDDGEWYIAGVGSTECVDGRTLKWNDHAWWYDGEGVHVHEPGDELVPPSQEREKCEP